MKHYDENKKYYRLLSDDYDAIKGQIYCEGDLFDYGSKAYVKKLVVDWPKDWEEVKFVDGKWVEANQKTYTLEEIESALKSVVYHNLSERTVNLLAGRDETEKAKNLMIDLTFHLNK